MNITSISLLSLADQLGGQLIGQPDVRVSAVSSIESATPFDVTFLSDKKKAPLLDQVSAGVVLISEPISLDYSGAMIIVPDAYVAFAKVSQMFDTTPRLAHGIHPTASIDPTAEIAEDVAIGAYTVIGPKVTLGSGVQIASGCSIGDGTQIGERCKIYPHVTIYHDVIVGHDCAIHAASVIGSDGFGYANDAGKWIKIPQVGRVVIGNRVEIGASVTIDRGTLEDTRIDDHVIIDNQVHLAHNVSVGYGSAIAGCVGVAGSTRIGKFCQIGGLSAIGGHISIADQVVLTGAAQVPSSISKPGVYSSMVPATPHKKWLRTIFRMRQFEHVYSKLKKIEDYVSKIKL